LRSALCRVRGDCRRWDRELAHYQQKHHAIDLELRPSAGRGWLPVIAALSLAVLLGIATWILLREATRPLDIIITAHRGGSLVAPENTVASIRAAAELGADWAEVDVQLTLDKRVIVGARLGPAADCQGPRKVAEITLEELQKVDAGAWFGEAFKGERVPTLEAVLDAAAAGKLGLNIELKPWVGTRRSWRRGPSRW
jgi:glycerophosphoryl diester phosphodiesterase